MTKKIKKMLDDSPLQTAIKTCKDWTNDTRKMMSQRMPQATGAGAKSLKSRVKLRGGEPYVITFNFERYMKYAELGAGKGRGGAKGSTWKDKFGQKRTTNPKSLNRMGTEGRYPQPFSDNTIQEQLPHLTDELAKQLADSVVKFATQ